jgi:hypothetical protein
MNHHNLTAIPNKKLKGAFPPGFGRAETGLSAPIPQARVAGSPPAGLRDFRCNPLRNLTYHGKTIPALAQW